MIKLKENIIDLNELENKINVIKNIDNEYCRYILSIYNNYKICIKENNENKVSEKVNLAIPSEEYSINQSCKTLDTKSKSVIFCFDDSNINNYKYVLDQNEKNVLVFINNQKKIKQIDSRIKVVSMSKSELKKILLNEKPDNVLIHINVDKLENNISWDNNIKNNLEKLLLAFINISLEDITNNPTHMCKKCTQNKYYKNNSNVKTNNFMLEDVIKLIINMKSVCYKNNIKFRVEYKENDVQANKNSKKLVNELKVLIHTLMCKNKKEMYEYIYDNLCNYLDNDCKKYNYCNFENNKCIAQRDSSNITGYPINKCNGCCYDVDKHLECNKMQNKTCTIKSISCKLFICRYLRDRGISYPTNKNLLIKTFLNLRQRPILIWNFFKPKEEIINKLMKIKKNNKV